MQILLLIDRERDLAGAHRIEHLAREPERGVRDPAAQVIASDRFKGRPCDHCAEREYRVEPTAAQCRGDQALGDGGVL